MGLGCPICSENLERQPAEAQQGGNAQNTDINICCTPCGHLFHTYCINKWLTGSLASSKQCPCCRKAVPQLKVLPLFPNGYEESFLEDGGGEGGGIIPCNCNVTISSLRQQLKDVDTKLKDAEDMLEIHRKSASEFKKKYDSEKVKSDHYLFQYKQLESFKTYSKEKETECSKLTDQLKKYQIIDSLVRGAQDEVESELSCYPATPETVKTLLEIQFTLKQEIQCVSKKLDQAKKEQEDVRIENSKFRKKYAELKQDYKELKKVHDSSTNFGDTPNRSLDLNKAIYGSRTPLVMPEINRGEMRKKVENIRKGDKEREIDVDIPLMQPFGQKLKRRKMLEKKKIPVSEKMDVIDLNGCSESLDFMPPTPMPERANKFHKGKSLEEFKKKKTDQVDEEKPCSSKSIAHSAFQPSARDINKTISLSSDSEDEDFMALRGGIPGMKINGSRKPQNSKVLQLSNKLFTRTTFKK